MKKAKAAKTNGKKTLATIKRMAKYFKRYWFMVLLAVGAGILSSSMAVAGSELIRRAVDALQAGAFASPLSYILPAVGILLAGAAANFFVRYASGRAATNTIRDIKNDAARHISLLTAQSLSKTRTGDFIARLTNDANLISRFVQDDLTKVLTDPFLLLFYLIYLIYLNPLLFVLCILPTAVFLPLGSRLITKYKSGSKRFMEFNAQTINTVVDMTGGMQVVKSYNLENMFLKEYTEKSLKARGAAIDNDRAQYKGYFCFDISSTLSYVLCLMFGAFFCLRGSLTLGGLVAFMSLMPHVSGIINGAAYRLFNINASIAAAERVFEIMDEPKEPSGTATEGISGAAAIEFDDVHFAYEVDAPVLKGASFSIKEGETVAIVGTSGGGKTTALNLACAFFRPQSGSIKIKGVDIADWDMTALRKNMSYVSQTAYLFPVSAKDNISFGKENSTMEEITAAAKSANADGFIASLPKGYDSDVGERGARLSGGQIQRIAIARAFLKDAPILLLDEATSALDVEAESEVQKALERLSEGRTVLIVAHRFSTIKNADRILVLDGGKVAESGAHAELMERGKVYPQLYSVYSKAEGGANDE